MDIKPVVFLVDDEDSILQAFRRELEPEGYEVRSWTSPIEFLAAHDAQAVGCLVCDLVMPAMSGFELQRALAARGATRPIVFITGRGDIRTAVQAMVGGAVTFIPKPVTRAELVAAVQEAIRRDVAARTLQREQSSIERRLAALTRRERQVMTLLTTGLRNKQIAAELRIAEKTVKVHRGKLMRKMQVSSVATLMTLLSVGSRSANGGDARPQPAPVEPFRVVRISGSSRRARPSRDAAPAPLDHAQARHDRFRPLRY